MKIGDNNNINNESINNNFNISDKEKANELPMAFGKDNNNSTHKISDSGDITYSS